MDARRRFQKSYRPVDSPAKASDAFLLPLPLTNAFFFGLFGFSAKYLMDRWSEKNRTSTPLNVLNSWEILSIVSFLASIIYLLGFFGIDFVQSFISRPDDFVNDPIPPPIAADPPPKITGEDAEIVAAVVSGELPSYSLESKLGDCYRAASIRRNAIQLTTGRSLDGLPVEGFNYDAILGQCCEMPIGYIQIPVGIAAPLLLDGREFSVPMATTEGCLVASANRGCKAIYVSGGATSVLLRDGMTRAPVVRFGTAKRAADLKFFLEDPINFDTLAVVFNRSSRFARLQGIQCTLAGKNLYMRFTCSTGDAMGMNMVSKGVQNVLDFLQTDFPDIDIISISGNFCSDKKPAAVNWIEGRGKSVVCEAIIKEDVVKKVLKTSVSALVELNMLKNLTGSAVAGALGGFNAHGSNIVSAVFIATGQDPAQNVESSHCITMMEAVNDRRDLHISVTMPCIEDKTYAIHVEKLKNYAKQLLEEETNHAAQIELIETNQWLGVGYLFDKEIKSALNYIKNKSDNSTNEVEDLHSVSLRFRLMRQHGYMVPQARVKRVTKKFGGDEKLPMAKLLLIADENCGGFPKKVESDSVRPSPNAKQNSGMRTPNLVARLMGLQSMPSGHRDKPKKSSAPGFAYYQEKEPSKTSEFYSYDS